MVHKTVLHYIEAYSSQHSSSSISLYVYNLWLGILANYSSYQQPTDDLIVLACTKMTDNLLNTQQVKNLTHMQLITLIDCYELYACVQKIGSV